MKILVIDRYWFFITDTDTDYLHVYVPDNRYAEPIFIYCYTLYFFFFTKPITDYGKMLKYWETYR